MQPVLLPLQHCAPQGSRRHQPGTWGRSPLPCVRLAWGLPGAMLQHRAVRQRPCPVPSWHTCSRAESWSWPKKEARDSEVLCLQPAFLYKLPFGRIFCPKRWARESVPWGECLPFGCHWFLSCLSFSRISHAWLRDRNSSLQISSNWLENCYCKPPSLALSLTHERRGTPFPLL